MVCQLLNLMIFGSNKTNKFVMTLINKTFLIWALQNHLK